MYYYWEIEQVMNDETHKQHQLQESHVETKTSIRLM